MYNENAEKWGLEELILQYIVQSPSDTVAGAKVAFHFFF
jgi:hypothetical protein